MTTAAADDSDTTAPGLRLGTVDRVRVRVGYRRSADAPVSDVFLLDLPGGRAVGAFDEAPYLRALEPVLEVGGGLGGRAAPAYSVHVDRGGTSTGAGDVEIRVEVTTGDTSAPLAPEAVVAAAGAFTRTLAAGGDPDSVELHHDDAIEQARDLAGEAFPELRSGALTVSEEEHRAAEGRWTVGFRTGDRDRYVVVVGFVDGYTGSAHVHHEPRSEVLDSVGSESQ